MFLDARKLGGKPLQADVCIIGAGPAGITLALELMPAGARVLVLEAGGEQASQPSRLQGGGHDRSYISLQGSRASGFAGTSNIWSTTARWWPGGNLANHPLDPVDLEARSWLPHSGWPFGHEELLPYYERAHRVLNIGPFEYRVEGVAADSPRAPLIAGSPRLETMLFRYAPPDPFRPYRDTLAAAPNVEVLFHAQAVELVLADGSDSVSHVRVRCEGAELDVSARLFVLAGGGIENARLLLLSRGRHPAGLGNGNDVVGRYFMEHPKLRLGRLRPKTSGWSQSLDLYRRHTAGGVAAVGTMQLKDSVRREEQLLGVVVVPRMGDAVFSTESFAAFSALSYYVRRRRMGPAVWGHLARIGRNPWAPLWGSYLLLRRQENRSSYFGLEAYFEQAPRPENRVRLGDERDELGLPRAQVEWRLGDDELDSLRRTYKLIGAELSEAGIATLEAKMPRTFGDPFHGLTHHHMGTTRMHVDPKHGVVDEDCRVHGVPNLFVAGSSVMPTAGATTVTLTLMALAIRLGDHLRRELAAGLGQMQGSSNNDGRLSKETSTDVEVVE